MGFSFLLQERGIGGAAALLLKSPPVMIQKGMKNLCPPGRVFSGEYHTGAKHEIQSSGML